MLYERNYTISALAIRQNGHGMAAVNHKNLWGGGGGGGG